MSDTPSGSSLLLSEHLALGASLGNFGPMEQVPLCYPAEAPEMSCAVTDLSSMLVALISGEDAPRLAELVFAGKKLEVGECSFETMLAGDGSLVGVPFVMRTGIHEYLVCDMSARQDLVGDWLLWARSLSSGEGPVFADCSFDDKSEAVVPILLSGERSTKVLTDYLGHEQVPPRPGTVRSITLDEIPCIAASFNLNDHPAYLLLLYPARAHIFWRSFLSFPFVGPLGLMMLRDKLISDAAWYALLDIEDKIELDPYQLLRWKLLRSDDDYIGYRGLFGDVT